MVNPITQAHTTEAEGDVTIIHTFDWEKGRLFCSTEQYLQTSWWTAMDPVMDIMLIWASHNCMFPTFMLKLLKHPIYGIPNQAPTLKWGWRGRKNTECSGLVKWQSIWFYTTFTRFRFYNLALSWFPQAYLSISMGKYSICSVDYIWCWHYKNLVCLLFHLIFCSFCLF